MFRILFIISKIKEASMPAPLAKRVLDTVTRSDGDVVDEVEQTVAQPAAVAKGALVTMG